MPRSRTAGAAITVNLAASRSAKEGSPLDLPIALGLMAHRHAIPPETR